MPPVCRRMYLLLPMKSNNKVIMVVIMEFVSRDNLVPMAKHDRVEYLYLF